MYLRSEVNKRVKKPREKPSHWEIERRRRTKRLHAAYDGLRPLAASISVDPAVLALIRPLVVALRNRASLRQNEKLAERWGEAADAPDVSDVGGPEKLLLLGLDLVAADAEDGYDDDAVKAVVAAAEFFGAAPKRAPRTRGRDAKGRK